MRKCIPVTTLLAVASGLLATGCGGSSGSVTGTVTVDGVPLKTGMVTFHPIAGGPAAIGGINADGIFELAIGSSHSVPPGDYVVTVDAMESVSSTQAPDPKKPPAPPKRITPEKYANKDSSDLKVTVKAGSQKVPLALKSGK